MLQSLSTKWGGYKKTPSSNKRINWIDSSRGLAFLMVIYSHLEYCNPFIMHFFSPVFLTTFFFVSGYLFKSHCSFEKVFEQRTRTLLWPLLSLGTIMIIMQHLLTFKEAPVPWIESFKGLLYQNGENTLLWFVAAIYIYSIIFYWIERFSGKYLFVVCILLFVTNWIYSRTNGPTFPWHIASAGYGCAYMGLGKLYRQYEDKIENTIKTYHIVGAFAMYIMIILLLNRSCSFSGSRWLLDSIVLTGTGLFVIVEASKRFPIANSKFLLFIGANTLFYFAFHGKGYSLIQTSVNKILSILNITHTGLLDTIIGFVIVLLDALLLIYPAIFVNRYCPWILGKGFKLWKT